jgi:hypothetical protein
MRVQMGWNPWNCFGVGRTGGCKLPLPWTGGTTVATGGCHNFNESIVLAIAEVMAERLHSSGYEFISLDCGYSTKRRDEKGHLVVNTTRYPHGMVWLGKKIHELGLKFGMYASMGWGQCCSQIDKNATDGTGPGCSKGGQCRDTSYYEQDAQLFASWKVDYLKFVRPICRQWRRGAVAAYLTGFCRCAARTAAADHARVSPPCRKL